jgi:glycerate dehydrogenase
MHSKFKRIVVLDPIVLLDEHRQRLELLAGRAEFFPSVNAREILKRLESEMADNPSPMCWTQLAQQEVTREELNRRLAGADAIITCWTSIPDDVLRANPQIRYIGFWTNLAEHRINMKLADEMGIRVTYLPDYGTESVAEMTLAGLLAVSRKVIQSAKDTERGKWPYELLKTGERVPSIQEIPQRMLNGKLLGIVGFGRIGQRVAELALAFRMRVQYFSNSRKPEWEAKGVAYADLDALFRTSDVASVHLSPYAPEKIISRELLNRLKDGAIFVNTSAGRLVDQEALFEELEAGRISAYLDVYEGLPPRQRFKNVSLKDNLFTYRAGWFTQEAVTYKGEALIKKLEAFLAGASDADIVQNGKYQEDQIEVPCACRKNDTVTANTRLSNTTKSNR